MTIEDADTAPSRWRAEAAELRAASWRGWPRRFVGWAFRRPLLASDEVTDFQEYAQGMSSGFGRLTAAVASILLIGLWPLDWWIYPMGDRRAWLSAAWRVAAAGVLLGALRVAESRERNRKNPVPAWITASVLAVGLSYLVAGELGDPTTPWIHTSLLVPLLSVPMLLGLVARAGLTLALAGAAQLAYYAPHPAYLASPYVAAIFGSLTASCVTSVVLGHALFVIIRRDFRSRVDLRRLSRTDALTGVWNRSYFLERADVEVLRARRSETPLAVLLVDLDRFKSVNDRFGHATGDAVLADFVARAQQVLRRTDVMGRLGGEEFAVLLTDTPLVTAVEAAERLRREVEEERPARALAGQALPAYTVSIGCAAFHHDDPNVDAILRRADLALYQAKGFGRNRVVSEPSGATSVPG
ncbi:MAG: GGDEF domain-containing protein [bacterium]